MGSSKCWLCGQTLGKHMTFPIGPMCAITRTTAEPPSHLACAEYAVKACPFLSQPRMRRNERDLPEACDARDWDARSGNVTCCGRRCVRCLRSGGYLFGGRRRPGAGVYACGVRYALRVRVLEKSS